MGQVADSCRQHGQLFSGLHLRRSAAERNELKARLERAERPSAMSAAQISELVGELGGLSAVLGAATGAERAQVLQAWVCVLTTIPICDESTR